MPNRRRAPEDNGPVASHSDPLYLIEAHFLTPAVVELPRARAGMRRHLRGLFPFSKVPPFFRYAVIPVARKL